jgi:transcription initiation factor TFIIE subunit alpha
VPVKLLGVRYLFISKTTYANLLTPPSLRDDDLAYLIGMNTKDLHKICAKLKEDRLLEVYV